MRPLNRKQFRDLSKKGMLYTADETAILIHNAEYKIMKRTITDYSAIVALCLRDVLGFGHERTARFLKKVDDMFKDLREERISFEDIKETLKNEIGVIIE